jgi:outer membrane immunogenic protein
MKRVLLACVAVVALGGVAAAADLPPAPGPAPYYKAPAYAPAYNWSGFYLGLNGGGGWGRSDWSTTGTFNTSGGLAGGTIGYNYQMNQVVLGVEGDIDWADINGTTNTGCTAVGGTGCRTSDEWLSTVRGRLGYAADRFMPYVTGGAAFGDIKASGPGLTGVDTTNAGWTVGGGIEFAIAGHWTAKAEYLYVDLGNVSCGTACGAATQNVSWKANIGRVGLNYRF